MQNRALSIALVCILSLSAVHADSPSAPAPGFSKYLLDVPAKTRAALQKIHVGQSEAEVIALLQPLPFDKARLFHGGTGNGQLYIRLSPTAQVCLDVKGPAGIVRAIGEPEPFSGWKPRPDGGIDFPAQTRPKTGRRSTPKR